MGHIYAAHIKDDGEIQPIFDHLKGTAKLAKEFADRFDSGDYAYLCGMLHDIGKYSEKFQKRIYEGGNPVDHSTAGAAEINKQFQTIGFLLAYCIAGHHTGLPDGGSLADIGDDPTLHGRLKKKLEAYTRFEAEIEPEKLLPKPLLPIYPLERMGFSVSFFVRMLFSCLVDGDFLDTEAFMSNGIERNVGENIEALDHKLEEYIKAFKNPTEEINKKRTDILTIAFKNHRAQRDYIR
jgi:CRISPR-associated endonuclease/helicase Cas3